MNARRIAIQELTDAGFVLDRHGAKHDIYRDPITRTMIPLRHSFSDRDLRVIRKEIKAAREKIGRP